MAIKVNGTTVINDSRQLQNVASLDATTVTAIGAAGVGGSLEFISETNITSDVSYIDISFPTGYRGFNISFNQIYRTGQNTNAVDLNAVLKDSSGNLLTANGTYTFSQWDEQYWYTRESWPLGHMGPDWAYSGPIGIGTSIHITIDNPRDADVQTSYASRGGGYLCEYNGITRKGNSYMGHHNTKQDNSGIRFSSNANISGNSHSYTVWGIK